MKRFQLWNTVAGWATFLVAAIVYLLTIEPTSSFWDCGEFISASHKMLVGHPPGAPLFLMAGRIATMFASSPATAAKMVNAMSALASAFTILFLFWTITHIARKLIMKDSEESSFSLGNILAVLGAGIVGALAYTFSDSFWFSAVEGEVYALSSLFTAVVFWAILKWENEAGKPFANRWIILIGYLIGLSIGVHLLNLLAIPAIALVYYFKKYPYSPKGTLIAFLLSGVMLGFIQYGIIPGVVELGAYFELFFINIIGLPYNSGIFIFLIALIGGISYGIYYTYKTNKVLLNTVLTFIAVIMLGYSSYAMIVVRSVANPPMNQNAPNNMFSLLSYLNREQYGDRPLFFGQYYSAPMLRADQGAPVRYQIGGKYKIIDYKQEIVFDDKLTTFLPRMYSSEPSHISAYQNWANIKGSKVQTSTGETVIRPTFGENLTFLFNYQLGHMYWRYFMWNFSGRQNNIQGHGDLSNGNWISGISFIDNPRLGDQKLLPDSAKENKGRNKYYMLPLILGLLGMVFQWMKKEEGGVQSLITVFVLFFMTGIAIVLYLNQYPYQPRERDYAFSGSFYAFAIWIGLGVLFFYELLKKYTKAEVGAVAATSILFLAVPVVMANQNWDDHDRSDRFFTRDFAANYLNSCEKNAIIFTNGDNDTFPLWYAQEVEGIRTDIRVCNLSYLQTDWYIDQMRMKNYKSDPLPFTLNAQQTIQGRRDMVQIVDRFQGKTVDYKKALAFLASEDRDSKYLQSDRGEQFVDYLPAKVMALEVDSQMVVNSGVVPRDKANRVESLFVLDFGSKRYIRKNDLMILDLIGANEWKRPIYFAITVPQENYVGLEKFFQVEGQAYRVIPVTAQAAQGEMGEVNTAIMYDNMMNKFKFGNANKKGIYMDEDVVRMCYGLRNNFIRLANSLVDEGKMDLAANVLRRSAEVLPSYNIPYNYYNLSLITAHYRANMIAEGNKVFEAIAKDTQQRLSFYLAQSPKLMSKFAEDIELNISVMRHLTQVAQSANQNELATQCMNVLKSVEQKISR